MQCDWCGKEIRGDSYGDFLSSKRYCSRRCKAEAEAEKASGRSSTDIDKSDNSGCLIFTIIKWIIIILIAIFVLSVVLGK